MHRHAGFTCPERRSAVAGHAHLKQNPRKSHYLWVKSHCDHYIQWSWSSRTHDVLYSYHDITVLVTILCIKRIPNLINSIIEGDLNCTAKHEELNRKQDSLVGEVGTSLQSSIRCIIKLDGTASPTERVLQQNATYESNGAESHWAWSRTVQLTSLWLDVHLDRASRPEVQWLFEQFELNEWWWTVFFPSLPPPQLAHSLDTPWRCQGDSLAIYIDTTHCFSIWWEIDNECPPSLSNTQRDASN